MKSFPAYLPVPFTTKLRDRLLIIDSEINKIKEAKDKQNARQEYS
jgi:hypothetical protein